tara:strand:+ start:4231 stop:5151 length:921 start_codon:yes stop_codon:yes gene_type:complete
MVYDKNDILKDLIRKFMPFAQKQIGFEKPPRLFLRRDSENANNPLGKTAFYDPNNMSVTLYVSGRHPKDILRSLGHELVHHKQNCDGMFSDSDDMGPGYAQKDPHLRRMEQEANRDGSMTLRDFEDMLKKENTIYYEHLQKGDNKMSTKDWKNEEIRTLLAEAWGFKFNTLEEFDAFNGTGEIQTEGENEAELEEGSMTPHKASDRRTPRGVGSADARRSGDADAEAKARKKVDEGEDHDDETMEEGEDHDDETMEEGEGHDKRKDKETMEEEAQSDDDDKAMEESDSEQELKEAIAAVLRKHLRG